MSDSPITPPTKSKSKNKSSLSPLQRWISYLSAPAVIALLTVLLLPLVEQANEEVELTYAVEITETTGSLINKNIIFTDDDRNSLKCPVPNAQQERSQKNKAPMQCKDDDGVVHTIEAIKPV